MHREGAESGSGKKQCKDSTRSEVSPAEQGTTSYLGQNGYGLVEAVSLSLSLSLSLWSELKESRSIHGDGASHIVRLQPKHFPSDLGSSGLTFFLVPFQASLGEDDNAQFATGKATLPPWYVFEATGQ